MKFFSQDYKEKPVWLESTRVFCRSRGITIMAWGPNMLVVEAESPERAAEIATLLAILGFAAIQDADDSYAGLLSLSHPE